MKTAGMSSSNLFIVLLPVCFWCTRLITEILESLHSVEKLKSVYDLSSKVAKCRGVKAPNETVL